MHLCRNYNEKVAMNFQHNELNGETIMSDWQGIMKVVNLYSRQSV